MKKTQVFFIHGGMTFKNRKDYLGYLKNRPISLEKKMYWSDDYLAKGLGNNFEIIRPRMPLQDNAKYEDWKIMFERYIPYLKDGVVLIGSSLGGVFLAKYLSENRFPRKILSTYLIGAPFDNTIEGEDLVGGFTLKSDLSKMEKNCQKIVLMFSLDDPVVPISHAEKYLKKLPHAKVIVFESKNGHFKISEFPEMVEMILEDRKKS